MTHDEYKQLVDKLNELSAAYHIEDKSIVSDTEYDKLYRQLKDYEEKNPAVISEDSPTQRVGELSTDNKVRHVYHMYSLDNAFNNSDMERFMKRFDHIDNSSSFYVDCKMDGLSVELVYNYGSLVRGTTRGDGSYGEDVTANVAVINNIPKYIPVKRFLVVRGEVVMFKTTLKDVNAKRVQEGQPKFSNCRNAAAGSLRQKDPKITEERNLKFYAWDLKVAGSKLTHNENMTCLSRLGFAVPKGYLCEDFDSVSHRISDIQLMRESLPYDIDGAVIKQNNTQIYNIVGWNRHSPMFSIAYKFKADGAETTITDISWKIGRTGKMTPVATINPVDLNGATISKVTLNNAAFVETNKLGIGSVVSVIRSGDVIPKIDEIIEPKGYTTLPTVCPCCGHKLSRISRDLKCENSECKERLTSALIFIVGNDLLNVKGIGEEFINKAVKTGTITKVTDIFSLIESKSPEVDQDLLDKLVTAAKDIDLVQLITILGIPDFGKLMASKLLREVKKVKDIKRVLTNETTLRQLSFSPSLISKITEWCKDPKNIEMLDTLSNINFNRC